MAGWILTAGLGNLRAQMNDAFPNRDRASDGTIGDTAHMLHASGHNPDDTPGSKPAWDRDADSLPEVRSWDMDSDLRAPGVDAQDVVDHVRRLPGVDAVLRYMIYNHRIYHADSGWISKPYSGASGHEEHVHFEGAWSDAADANTSFNYHLEDLVAMIDADDVKMIWNQDGIVTNPPERSDAKTNPSVRAAFAIGDSWARIIDLQASVSAQGKALGAAIAALASKDTVDEQALAVALAPAIIALLPADQDDVTVEELTAALRALITPAA